MRLPILLGIFILLLLCFQVNSAYASDGNAVLNGIGDLIFGFVTFIIEALVGVISAILNFFGSLLGGLTLWI